MNPNTLNVCNINVIKKSFEKYFIDREKEFCSIRIENIKRVS